MIVCVCHYVSDREVKAEIARGVTTVDGLKASLGVATCCGQCENCVQELVNDVCMSGSPAQEAV